MSDRKLPPGQPSGKKGGGFIPAFCNAAGTLMLLAVIAAGLAVTAPRFLGYGVYEVVSGSMEPEIPVHSAVYIKKAAPEEVRAGDVIAFQSGDSVIIHRVVENHVVEGSFTTKGDANAEEDMQDVPYARLVGRAVRHYPLLGGMMSLYTSGVGRAYVICFAACGAMFNILAGRIRARRRGS